jgi:hypothetical protein
VPALRDDLHVFVPISRGPGKPWKPGPVPVELPEQRTGGAATIRIGYARCSTAGQELASQLEALTKAGCYKVFHEKISTRIKHRPEFAKKLVIRTGKNKGKHTSVASLYRAFADTGLADKGLAEEPRRTHRSTARASRHRLEINYLGPWSQDP